ncbi:Carboxylic ester hydrolase [Coniochaeta hoffmannii]|uniref:Carboxylic ester hydrolase n=1 Tax=Coniochaeta hoffmannii TaxID=91930 RepID=A0AA38R8U1_9PEZI|nr:Carboxylic ester hydrolase [Coniochaeta hoffmannii]
MTFLKKTLLLALLLGSSAAATPPSLWHRRKTCQPVDPCDVDFLASGLKIKDAQLLDLTANWTIGATVTGANGMINYCNVLVTYTHPGWNDTIHTQVLLPATKNWNGRFQGVGGGGWAANSGVGSLMAPLGQNYSTGNTDAGHNPSLPDTSSWHRGANGDLNIPLLTDFASVALGDLADIGKQLSRKYYGYGPVHSYWNGCSTGGRQGWIMAQKYPGAYDGIYAAAPAAQWDRFQVAQYWGQFVMNQLQHWPNQCVFDAFTAAVVAACDGLDGVTDGVISNFDACKWDPATLVGTTISCSGGVSIKIVDKDATIVSKVWQGPRASDGSFLWWGIQPGAPFSGLTGTTCTNVTNCKGAPFSITSDWMTRWCIGDADFDLTALTLDEYTSVFYECKHKYEGIIGTNDIDLQPFARAGGKMISWHGLADQLIYPLATGDYYQRVLDGDPDAPDYFRFFYAPGVQHCGGGAGEAPTNPFQAVVDWVEKGVVPVTLPAGNGAGRTRNLCLYPLVSVYVSGDPNLASSFECRSHF